MAEAWNLSYSRDWGRRIASSACLKSQDSSLRVFTAQWLAHVRGKDTLVWFPVLCAISDMISCPVCGKWLGVTKVHDPVHMKVICKQWYADSLWVTRPVCKQLALFKSNLALCKKCDLFWSELCGCRAWWAHRGLQKDLRCLQVLRALSDIFKEKVLVKSSCLISLNLSDISKWKGKA